MFWLFDANHPVMVFLSKIMDCVFLSILWFLGCIPILTVGASTNALYGSVESYIRNDEGHLVRGFLERFRKDFGRTTKLWLIILGIVGLIAADFYGFQALGFAVNKIGKLYWLVMVILCAAVGCWIGWLFPYAARVPTGVVNVLRDGFVLVLTRPKETLFILFVNLTAGILFVVAPGLLALFPAAFCWLKCILTDRVFNNPVTA